jgi:hypothetical protein
MVETTAAARVKVGTPRTGGRHVKWIKKNAGGIVRITLTIEGGETPRFLTEGVKTIMESITDFAAKVNANFTGIQTGIKGLDDKITAFQNSPGTLSPEDQAALDDIVDLGDSRGCCQCSGTPAPVA